MFNKRSKSPSSSPDDTDDAVDTASVAPLEPLSAEEKGAIDKVIVESEAKAAARNGDVVSSAIVPPPAPALSIKDQIVALVDALATNCAGGGSANLSDLRKLQADIAALG